MKAASASTVKHANRHAITAYLYRHHGTTKQMLERELGLSLPTITANLRALMEDGLAATGEPQESTGGRKAQTYEFVAEGHVAIGVALRATETTMVAVDLRGRVLDRRSRTAQYRNNDAYYSRIGAQIMEFAATLAAKGHEVLGVAFAIQGIVSADGNRIDFGEVVGNTGLTLDRLAQGVHLPVLMIHDSDASAMAELWFDPGIRDAVCIYLERRPGGAVIVDGRLYQGPNLANGTIEHMVLDPDGPRCYCGQRGCMDTVCSPETLPEEGESLPGFFSVLEQGEPDHRRRFEAWLDNVARAIVNIRTVLAGDIILGGEAAQYLDESDIARLRARVQARSPFPTTHFTLRKSGCADDQNVVGAALRFIEPYVARLTGE